MNSLPAFPDFTESQFKPKFHNGLSLFLPDHDNSEERPVSVNKQRLGAMGDRPARPSLIEQVLNQKRLVSHNAGLMKKYKPWLKKTDRITTHWRIILLYYFEKNVK